MHASQRAGQHILHSGVQLAGLTSRAYDAPRPQQTFYHNQRRHH